MPFESGPPAVMATADDVYVVAESDARRRRNFVSQSNAVEIYGANDSSGQDIYITTGDEPDEYQAPQKEEAPGASAEEVYGVYL